MARGKPKPQSDNKKPEPDKPNSWPADRVRRLKTDDLVPCARNARLHTDGQVLQLAEAIKRFGFTNPVIVDESGEIIAGHGRVMAAKRLGLEEVPGVVIAAGEWSEDDRRAYRIWDNQSALLSEWDDTMLKVELADLKLAAYPLDVTGFGQTELANLLPPSPAAASRDPDVIPEPPADPVSRTGDIWVMGSHRVFCGDSTAKEDVSRLLGEMTVDLILTDPPYCSGGFQESNRSAGSVGTNAPHKQVANDRLSSRGYQALLKAAIASFNAKFLYAFTDWRMWVWLFDVAESSGFGVRSMIVWDKGTPGMGRGWRSQHELVLWAGKEVMPFKKHSPANGNVIQCSRTGNHHHTTEKPVELLCGLLKVTEFAKVVGDPFLGSGSTLIACEKMERTCFGVEMDAAYVDVTVRRWETFTDRQAILSATGQTFDQVARERVRAPDSVTA